jgi:hypothetical protein
MIAQYDALFTGQLVVGLTALLGLISIGVKVLGRKAPAQTAYVPQQEFHEFRRDMARDLDAVRTRLDQSFDRVLQRLDDHKSEVLLAQEKRSQAVQDRLHELQAQVARLDERTKGDVIRNP